MPDQQGGKDDKDLSLDWLAAELASEDSDTAAASADAAAAAADADADAEPSEPASRGFLWGLTPTTEPDPAVEASRRNSSPQATPVESAGPDAPLAAAPPAAAPPAAAPPAAAPPGVPAPPVPAVAPEPSELTQPIEPLTKPPAPARRATADLEPAPWWTTPAQSRLAPTEEEEAAALGRRTSSAAPSPLGTGVAPRVAATPGSAAAPRPVHASASPVESAAAAPVAASAASAPRRTPAAASGIPAPAGSAASTSPDDASTGSRRSGDGAPPRRPTKRTLAWVGGALVAVLVIVGLFFLSQNLSGNPVAAPTESATAEPSVTPTPTPSEVPAPTAPQPAGVHAWNTMFGTECLEPFSSPWDEEFTVVDCAAPHTAQLVYRGTLEGEPGSPFPGEQAFADQINVLCSAPGVINYEEAGAYADVQLQGSYPVTAEQWDAGDRNYYCFASRSSGEPLTSSLAPVA